MWPPENLKLLAGMISLRDSAALEYRLLALWGEGRWSAPTLSFFALELAGGQLQVSASRGPSCKASLGDPGGLSRSTGCRLCRRRHLHSEYEHDLDIQQHRSPRTKPQKTTSINGGKQDASEQPYTGSHARQSLRRQAHLPQTPDESHLWGHVHGDSPCKPHPLSLPLPASLQILLHGSQ